MCASLTRLAAIQTRVQSHRLASQVVQTHTSADAAKTHKTKGTAACDTIPPLLAHPARQPMQDKGRSYPGRVHRPPARYRDYVQRLQLSFVCSSHAEADVTERSASVDSVGQAGPSRRQERALAFTSRPQISLPGENRYSGMAGQGDKFGKEVPGSYTPGSAVRKGNPPNMNSFISTAVCVRKREKTIPTGIRADQN